MLLDVLVGVKFRQNIPRTIAKKIFLFVEACVSDACVICAVTGDELWYYGKMSRQKCEELMMRVRYKYVQFFNVNSY